MEEHSKKRTCTFVRLGSYSESLVVMSHVVTCDDRSRVKTHIDALNQEVSTHHSNCNPSDIRALAVKTNETIRDASLPEHPLYSSDVPTCPYVPAFLTHRFILFAPPHSSLLVPIQLILQSLSGALGFAVVFVSVLPNQHSVPYSRPAYLYCIDSVNDKQLSTDVPLAAPPVERRCGCAVSNWQLT
jgi:hypothetical protein